jgi:hypothetical protein
MTAYFVLDERGEPRREMDRDAWARWFERAERGLARTVMTDQVTVVTIFIGVHAAPEHDTPLLFETRVFGGVLDGAHVARGTRAEALAAHCHLAAWCRIGAEPHHGLTEEQIS